MSIRLRELIKFVRQSKTAAEERAVVSKECANIRTLFKQDDAQYRRRNIAKLLFIHMLGYPTQFAQMECLKLIASNSFTDKRMGYLGLMLLLDEKQEVLMLVTNSLQNDLRAGNQYVVGLALCSLANISSTGIARDLANDVINLLGNPNPYLRKKAALCSKRILRKAPELMEQFVPKIRPLLAERNHGVVITAITLMIELAHMDQANVIYFRKAVPQLVKLLKSLLLSGYAPEYDVNGITDPFLQVKILRLLRILGKGDPAASDAMNDILAQVATNTESARNVGNAILYECVQTIMAIESESGLRVLAVNILGRFLMNKDNNIRYVALNTLQRVVDRDQPAVQRHRAIVLDCLKDPDISIRKRALDLTYALVNHQNIKLMVKELIQFLKAADLEFREDITAKICLLTYKFAPTPKWHIDTIFKVMNMAGHYVQDDVVASTIHLITRTPELHNYAVHKLFTLLTNDILKQPLVQTAVWTIGEYGDLLITSGKLPVSPADIIDLLDRIVKHPATSLQTKQYILTAVVKLSDRLKQVADVKANIFAELTNYTSSLTLELQQRACEYFSMLSTVEETKQAEILDHVPALEFQEDPELQGGYEASSVDTSSSSSSSSAPYGSSVGNDLLSMANDMSAGASTPAPAPAGNDLLSLLGGGPSLASPAAPAPSSGGSLLDLLGGGPSLATPAPAPLGGGGSLLDLLGGGGGSLAPSASPLFGGPSPVLGVGLGGAAPALPPIIAYSKNGIQLKFDFLKQPGFPNVTLINSTLTNATPVPLVNFVVQAAVPPYMTIALSQATGTVLPANNAGAITQQIKITNNAYGQQPPAIKLKIDFQANGNAYSDEAVVTAFPPGV
eukprot:TRINITY_DN1544_c3_g2_i2.p1 TRINITY_DN1544_c3_g2~~TRINITY_DN1544_c3_g2_i2.p1  ORF type:complete len:867 (+),score=475.34 TRINITY_DN1544_c3_g2_i2:57-2603(+)